MTSEAVVAGIVRTARRLTEPPPPPPAATPIRFAARDAGTAIAILLALAIAFTRLRGWRRLRVATRIAVIAYLGVIAGDMLSQGLLLGWVESGVPWRTAPGLLLLAAVAVVVPVTSGHQTYCHQLCAHGALQELLRRAPWQRPMPPRLARALRRVPGVTLLVVGIVFVLQTTGVAPLGWSFAGVEPFGAWALPLAGWMTCAVAGIGLIAASFWSMAYCRLGCPTGKLLDVVRRGGSGPGTTDAALAGLLALAVVLA